MVSINKYLEGILSKISLSDKRIQHIRSTIKGFVKRLKNVNNNITRYEIGGSFDKYTALRQFHDVDIYICYGAYPNPPVDGASMLTSLYNVLRVAENKWNYISIARDPPYLHAIPVMLNNDIPIDCLAAIENSNAKGTYWIPEGNGLIYSNLPVDDERLSRFNERTNGLGLKIIRLLKLWNYTHEKPFKSCHLERITIATLQNLTNLSEGIANFFQRAENYLRSNPQFRNAIGLQTNRLGRIYQIIQAGENAIQRDQWQNLFPY